jgi:hypothetical protein
MADREKLIELIAKFCGGLAINDVAPPYGYENLADSLISNGVTVRERGRWIQRGKLDEDGNGQYYCSVCSAGETHNPIVDVPYCWKCGADMRGEEDA